ncbi:hypothetical protein CR513_02593, partial [Mucuna pruriens]
MRHRGQPTRSMALVSSASEDTHELSNDCTETGDDIEDSEDMSEKDIEVAVLGGDKFSLNSNLGLLALLLISLHNSNIQPKTKSGGANNRTMQEET